MKRKKWLLFMMGLLMAFAAGCGLFYDNGKEEIDPPQEVVYEDEVIFTDEDFDDQEGTEETVQTELYLIDANGYVVPKTFALPKTESIAKQALEHLVTGGPLTNVIPNDFRTVLPAGTTMTVAINDGVATVDFSREFAEYAPEDEQRILQAVTWTLTQFDTVDKVKLQINGTELTEMPVAGTPITSELSRQMGINMETSDVVDITNTRPVTVYYIAQTDEQQYLVPVTKRIKKSVDNTVAAIVEELIRGPHFESDLYSLFMPDVKLLEEPEIKDGIVTLNFNENLISSYDESIVSQGILDQIVLTLTEQEGIEGVAIEVNGEAELMTHEGTPIDEPVTRPRGVNMEGF